MKNERPKTSKHWCQSGKNICDAETVGISKTTLGFRFIINGVHYELKIILLTAL